jgi:hypothetical protein
VLENQAPLECWCHEAVMLVRVVGVQSVCHVSANQEGLAQRALNSTLLTLHRTNRALR